MKKYITNIFPDLERIIYMRILFLLIAVVLIVSSCPAEGGRIYDTFFGKDQEAPVLLSYSLRDNSIIRLVYSEDVTIIEMKLGSNPLVGNPTGTVFLLPLGRTLEKGEEAIFYVTSEDSSGNTSRSAIKLVGRNMEIPDALINEVSPKGTETSPDRIEILFLEEGSAAGLVVTDALIEDAEHYVILPDIHVKPYDTIVIYWDSTPDSFDMIFDNGFCGYIVEGGSDKTLSGTNGAVLLYSEIDGYLMDGIIYTTGESELCDGYGNTKTENAAIYMMRTGEWEGDAISSLDVTASRVIARFPGGVDTNTSADFFITDTSESTFGMNNVYIPYEGD